MVRRSSGRARKFNLRYELRSIDSGIEQMMDEVGTTIAWYVYDPQNSEMHYTYDESSIPVGRRYKNPVTITVMPPHRVNSGAQGQAWFGSGGAEGGLYTVDHVEVMTTVRIARLSGITPEFGYENDHLRDRFVWDGKIWRPDHIQVNNLVGDDRRLWVRISAVEVTADEIVNDPTFLHDTDADDGLPSDGEYDWQESGVRVSARYEASPDPLAATMQTGDAQTATPAWTGWGLPFLAATAGTAPDLSPSLLDPATRALIDARVHAALEEFAMSYQSPVTPPPAPRLVTVARSAAVTQSALELSEVITAASDIVITLPATVVKDQPQGALKMVGSAVGAVVLTCNTGQTFDDGTTTKRIVNAGDSITVVGNAAATGWDLV